MISTWPASTKDVFSENDYFTIYPVPADDNIYIAMKEKGIHAITIVNAIGQKMWDATINSSISLPVDNWPKGVYFINVVTAEGKHQTKQMMIKK